MHTPHHQFARDLGARRATRPVAGCLAVLSAAITLCGCAGDTAPAPYQELYDLGIDRYVGSAAVQPESQWDEPSVANPTAITHYLFGALDAAARRPICMRGAEYQVDVEEGTTDELMIFLQGGGLCVDEVCIATETPLPLNMIQVLTFFGGGGVLNRQSEENPLANANLVYVPYCDGSIFIGDIDRQLQGSMAYQRGLMNVTAALEIAKARFPNPSRIVLVGTSGGSYGSLPAMALLRKYYASTEVVVISDSGAPIGQDQDTTFMQRTMVELNANYVPASCPDCVADGHLTGFVEWSMERDTHSRYGYMSHAEDHTIGTTFLGITGAEFATGVKREIAGLLSAYPSRTSAFVIEGTKHTFIQDIGLVAGAADAFFPGADLGDLTESGADTNGNPTTGWQWVQGFLAGPNGPNVLAP